MNTELKLEREALQKCERCRGPYIEPQKEFGGRPAGFAGYCSWRCYSLREGPHAFEEFDRPDWSCRRCYTPRGEHP